MVDGFPAVLPAHAQSFPPRKEENGANKDGQKGKGRHQSLIFAKSVKIVLATSLAASAEAVTGTSCKKICRPAWANCPGGLAHNRTRYLMNGISKTIPQSEGAAAVEALYDGSLTTYEFHMAGSPSRLHVGDYVYTIFQDQLIGRCQIVELVSGQINPDSGKPRTLVLVRCPGERPALPVAYRGHRGTRYFDTGAWPGGATE
jgi:hypothetical protein